MLIKDLIAELSKLPEDATIGMREVDDEGDVWGNRGIFIYTNYDANIKCGAKTLDYYLG